MTENSFDDFVEALRQDGTPMSAVLVHDLVYIKEALDQIFLQVDSPWHNPALALHMEMLVRDAVEVLETKVTRYLQESGNIDGLHDLASRYWQELMCDVFIAGYIAGEGPEHIKKCTCTEVDPSLN